MCLRDGQVAIYRDLLHLLPVSVEVPTNDNWCVWIVSLAVVDHVSEVFFLVFLGVRLPVVSNYYDLHRFPVRLFYM